MYFQLPFTNCRMRIVINDFKLVNMPLPFSDFLVHYSDNIDKLTAHPILPVLNIDYGRWQYQMKILLRGALLENR